MEEVGTSSLGLYRAVLNTVPFPVFVVDEDVRIHLHNAAALKMMPPGPESFYLGKGGEVLRCIHSDQGCGEGPRCSACPIRDAVEMASRGTKVVRQRAWLEMRRGKGVVKVYLLVTVNPLEDGKDPRYVLLLEDITELLETGRLLSICSSCQKVRSDADTWERIERYFHKNLGLEFSHGLCPECLRDHFPEFPPS